MTSPVVIDVQAGDDLVPLAGAWRVDPSHSSIEFIARYAVFTRVRGRFTSFSGVVAVDPRHLDTAQVSIDIEAASVDTAHAVRDAHLRSADFLHVQKHEQIRFRSVGVSLFAAGRYKVDGRLTIRGVEQPVGLLVTAHGCAPDVLGTSRLSIHATSTIDRESWGINWNQPVLGGGVVLAPRVDLDLAVSLVPLASVSSPASATRVNPGGDGAR